MNTVNFSVVMVIVLNIRSFFKIQNNSSCCIARFNTVECNEFLFQESLNNRYFERLIWNKKKIKKNSKQSLLMLTLIYCSITKTLIYFGENSGNLLKTMKRWLTMKKHWYFTTIVNYSFFLLGSWCLYSLFMYQYLWNRLFVKESEKSEW